MSRSHFVLKRIGSKLVLSAVVVKGGIKADHKGGVKADQ